MTDQLDLKQTINLPKTRFPMKANLPVLESRMLEEWGAMDLYGKIRASRKGKETFILHDGPPYANGHIHLGHALNKILKDVIVKSKTMQGFDSPYVPGWDCHGLPIEIKVMAKKRDDMDLLQVRQECREYADRFVNIQKEEFKRLGVFGEWDAPYLTMDKAYVTEIVRLFAKFVEKGSVYKGLRPVHWCISCETALAEAEVEYGEHTSPSVYVKFPVTEGLEDLGLDLAGHQVFALIWTTTPWTLPANRAICFHPLFEYSFVEVQDEVYIVARELLKQVAEACGLESYRVIHTVKGEDLKRLVFRHPWIDRDSKGILADHVTLEQGTGAVHTAPGHGHEDYLAGLENDLEIYSPVDSQGRFTSDVELFSGLQVFEANSRINEWMGQKNALLAEADVEHSYPHCWRCHHPVIFRATSQWFISMDHADLRQDALEQVKQVRWIPSWGEERISNMIACRPDWCISRQRIWGVPIIAFYCQKCSEPLLRSEIVNHVAEIFQQEGADVWFSRDASELLPDGVRCPCGHSEFEKESDILDVWFDSGVSHQAVLEARDDLSWPADVYLEGGDQFRGWFHTSLLVSLGTRGKAPYRSVVCSGWALDEEGRAMSKSRGNVISPLDVMKTNGAEILRLWVSSITYTEDVRLGEEILTRLREAYRKIRNTHRFMLGNLFDFEPAMEVSQEDLTEIDRWALARMGQVAKRVEEAFERFEFHVVYHTLYNFCVVDLSSFYLDVLKDRLYTFGPDSTPRRAAQTTLFRITDTLVRLLAPILPFTCEEIWSNLHVHGETLESVHLAEFTGDIQKYRDDELLNRWEQLLEIRTQVSKSLEARRQQKHIGNSLEAKVRLSCGTDILNYLEPFADDLRFLFIVSDVELLEASDQDAQAIEVEVSKASGEKCARCWTFSPSVRTVGEKTAVCERCYAVLEEMGRVPQS
ncbi:MAG: isoleucine--tRNA ligase [Acidobacteriota bacterium]